MIRTRANLFSSSTPVIIKRRRLGKSTGRPLIKSIKGGLKVSHGVNHCNTYIDEIDLVPERLFVVSVSSDEPFEIFFRFGKLILISKRTESRDKVFYFISRVSHDVEVIRAMTRLSDRVIPINDT